VRRRSDVRKITLVWYDVLVHLEDVTDGLGMTELANRILGARVA
jgi:hypothetical protein